MQSEKAIGNGYHLQLMNGVLFVILFASAAYQLSQWHYISLLGISPLIVGIVLGMIYGNTLRLHLPVYWLPGILFSSKVLLLPVQPRLPRHERKGLWHVRGRNPA